MALFNRRKDQTISDLEDYYANRNNRTGMAWLMAFLSLLVTIAVVAALFFGGRWVYRSLTNENTTVTTTSSNTENDSEAIEGNTATSTPENGTAPANTSNVEPEGVVSGEAARTATPNTGRTVAGTSTTTPRTGDSSLPNTGTGEIVYMILLAAGAFGYLIGRRHYARR